MIIVLSAILIETDNSNDLYIGEAYGIGVYQIIQKMWM